MADPTNMHFLLATDTYQGRATAEAVASVLRKEGTRSVEVVIPPRFSTRSQQDFDQGIRETVRWCEETFGPCKEAHCPVSFNLVGGFKSMQGYLNTIGMFYADEIVYIFEGPGSPVLRIPRLPIRLDPAIFHQEAALVARLAEGATVVVERLKQWPEALWEETAPGSGIGWLSTWGLLVWERSRGELLSQTLLEFPRLHYFDSFRRDFAGCKKNRRELAELQQRLARVSVLLDEANGDSAALKRDASLQYDNYSGKFAGVGHFRINNRGWRATCTSGEGKLQMRRFGDHEINDSPL